MNQNAVYYLILMRELGFVLINMSILFVLRLNVSDAG